MSWGAPRRNNIKLTPREVADELVDLEDQTDEEVDAELHADADVMDRLSRIIKDQVMSFDEAYDPLYDSYDPN